MLFTAQTAFNQKLCGQHCWNVGGAVESSHSWGRGWVWFIEVRASGTLEMLMKRPECMWFSDMPCECL